MGIVFPGLPASPGRGDACERGPCDGGDVSATPQKPGLAAASWVGSPRAFIAPLALAQFICSFAGSNMNVMINDISHDLNTDVKGVQTCITLFLLIMAVLMIPCSKLTDRWGRKRCYTSVCRPERDASDRLLCDRGVVPVRLLPLPPRAGARG